MKLPVFALLALFATGMLRAANQIPSVPGNRSTPGDVQLTEYFRTETRALGQKCLADITTLADWTAKRAEYRRQLQEMLGLWPAPERTDLKPVITGRVEEAEFTVEKLEFQALPGLYCTANVFLPRKLDKPVPAILYESGHYRSVSNGISYGNKGVYQLDGAWYARNGYVCLVLDTVLAGEIMGIHTGTRDNGLWWWNARGYTPAGVEAWFGIRALDYLCTRQEVDTNRLGITGHSGGGAYTWTVTALDDRIKAAAPLAGMADAQSHMLDGVIDSHCDCNFFINTYRWDFPQIAALAAPRPLLIGGTDRDGLFNLENTIRIHEKVRRLYGLYGAATNLGLVTAPGPHAETPELQVGVMRWFNRFLKGAELPVDNAAKTFFSPAQLKVFATLPADAINTNIASSFVPLGQPVERSAADLRALLRAKVFGGWPDEEPALEPQLAFTAAREGVRFRAWDFMSEHDVPLRLYLLENANAAAAPMRLTVLDAAGWSQWLAALRPTFGDELKEEIARTNVVADAGAGEKLRGELTAQPVALAFLAPRGVGLNAWNVERNRLTQIRRRFMLMGQTVDGMRVWDIRRAIQAAHFVRSGDAAQLELRAEGTMAVNALYAALFEPSVKKLSLTSLPKSHAEGPDYLNVLKFTDIPQVEAMVSKQAEIKK